MKFQCEFEHIILLALLRLEERAYGVRVRQEVELRTDRDMSIGAVYATLDRRKEKIEIPVSQGIKEAGPLQGRIGR